MYQTALLLNLAQARNVVIPTDLVLDGTEVVMGKDSALGQIFMLQVLAHQVTKDTEIDAARVKRVIEQGIARIQPAKHFGAGMEAKTNALILAAQVARLIDPTESAAYLERAKAECKIHAKENEAAAPQRPAATAG